LCAESFVGKADLGMTFPETDHYIDDRYPSFPGAGNSLLYMTGEGFPLRLSQSA
jgi:hypothetical protein